MSLDFYLERKLVDPETKEEVFTELYSNNITHNLGAMAAEAGIYKHLWRPEEIGVTRAEQMVGPLRVGLQLLESDPVRFRKFNDPNGWGMYHHFVPFVRGVLEACEKHPQAWVRASR